MLELIDDTWVGFDRFKLSFLNPTVESIQLVSFA